jgi:hypothetical protein
MWLQFGIASNPFIYTFHSFTFICLLLVMVQELYINCACLHHLTFVLFNMFTCYLFELDLLAIMTGFS